MDHSELYLIILILGFTAELKTSKTWGFLATNSSSYYLSDFVDVQTMKKPKIIYHSHQ